MLLLHEHCSWAPARIRGWDGTRLQVATGPFEFCGDVDRDGFEDVVIGDPDGNRVLVCAGPGRRIVAEPPVTVSYGGRYLGCVGVADVDGDGVRDFLSGRYDLITTSGTTRTIMGVRSGRTGAFVSSITGPRYSDHALAFGGVGDLGGDRLED